MVATYITCQNPLTKQFLLNFKVNFCCGGYSFMEILHQKEIGKESFDIIIKKNLNRQKGKPGYFTNYY